MSDQSSRAATAAAAASSRAAVVPVALALALLGLGAFGIGLAAHARDAFGPVAGLAFAGFALVTAMRYFGARV